MMEIFRILDEMEQMVKNSKKVPLMSGKVLVESHRFLDRLDRMRAILPEDLETARILLAEKERIVKEACAEAETVMEHSRDRVARMVDDNEITRNAMKMAEDIIAKAEQVANEIRRDADEYADGLLSHMEIVLKKGLDAVQQGKEAMRQE
ncbi:MAG: ATPase [Syntrophomonas sp.]|uniref:ATPase n=1 Tax=Syntrophomonas sp. TaxID=2053627 RepID=UPI002636B930|nr:ATPase [Syntrophomonas sp.]MDD2510127.1 ATPase [Syntrophomonas sp.]MDD3878530.1 ATPase [Syntrophomonas sp.]MDD4626441.1 ATPase [Syntrophomonas sp.]